MAEDASAFVAALDSEQRALASFALDDERERTDWAYFPRAHKGLPLHRMDLRQQKLAHALVSSALSVPAYAQVCAIMALESVLDLLEGRSRSAVRDAGRYFISIFGTPGSARWGWRLEGHHVNLNFTIVDGEVVSPTPLFLGANPAEVTHGASTVSRPCAAEEDAARSLLDMLDADQRSAAIICDVAPPDFVLTNLPLIPDRSAAATAPGLMRDAWAEFEPHKRSVAWNIDRPLGLPASRMTSNQFGALADLVDVYLDRLPEPFATFESERIAADEVHFAWAGSTARREGHYYRLQAPGFLVEYDKTQDGANHVHAVWRSPTRDFGIDVLRRHLIDH